MNRLVAVFLLIACPTARVSLASSADAKWVVSDFAEPPVTAGGTQSLESTDTVPPAAWHARQTVSYQYDFALADRASQILTNQSFGAGLPGRIELGLSLSLGWTFGFRTSGDDGPGQLKGMGAQGFALGDLKPYFLFSVFKAEERGFGLLFGLKGGIPTGDNKKLLGEGEFSLEPMVAGAVQIFGSRLCLNLAYLVRPEHVIIRNEKRFEQDDDLIWRIGIRIPGKKDVAWSAELEGRIGMLTKEGPWPSSASRPLHIEGGLDFPLGRHYRLGVGVGFGLMGETVPLFTSSVSLFRQPELPDEDNDGISGSADKCRLLKEDKDGFKDEDGCPDLDNDADGFPDDEDRCPLTPADDFSEDGCPDIS